jgi:two-component system response regulator YesN
MYRVVIVDDEPSIRVGLKTIVDWQKCGYVVVGDAASGREALEKHRQLSPDLIVIDIRMPGMDGLQVIEEIKKTDEACHFIILSGYADFDYAKRAITWGVNGYMLKPVDETEMEEELKRVGILLQSESKQTKLAEKADALYREELLHRLLFSQSADLSETLAKASEELGLSAMGNQIVLIELGRQEGAADSAAYVTVKRKLAEAFGEQDKGIVFSAGPHLGILLRGPLAGVRAEGAVLELLKEAVGPGIGWMAATGEAVKDVADITHSYAEALHLLTGRFMLEGERIYSKNNAPFQVRVSHPGTNHAAAELNIGPLADKLFYSLDTGNSESLEHAIEEASKTIVSFNFDEQAVKMYFAQLLSTVLNKLEGSNQDNFSIVQEYMPMIVELYKQPNYHALIQRVKLKLTLLKSRLGNASNQPVIKQMIRFIERHYTENLKLETLSELFNYNSGYLGQLFKSHTGESFHTYLDKIRIQHAIELLAQGHKVHQIAERVGYANADYFHSKFKKYLGVSPSSFKGSPVKKIGFASEDGHRT